MEIEGGNLVFRAFSWGRRFLAQLLEIPVGACSLGGIWVPWMAGSTSEILQNVISLENFIVWNGLDCAVPFFSLINWETGASEMRDRARDWSEQGRRPRRSSPFSAWLCLSLVPVSQLLWTRKERDCVQSRNGYVRKENKRSSGKKKSHWLRCPKVEG